MVKSCISLLLLAGTSLQPLGTDNTLPYSLLSIWHVVDIFHILKHKHIHTFCHLSFSSLLFQTKEDNCICFYLGEDYLNILISLLWSILNQYQLLLKFYSIVY